MNWTFEHKQLDLYLPEIWEYRRIIFLIICHVGPREKKTTINLKEFNYLSMKQYEVKVENESETI